MATRKSPVLRTKQEGNSSLTEEHGEEQESGHSHPWAQPPPPSSVHVARVAGGAFSAFRSLER
uniref:Uncharacterized protein n=1 Tax=Oryza brachyantha TaxID=4533 RepID=J3LGU0_ORYBR